MKNYTPVGLAASFFLLTRSLSNKYTRYLATFCLNRDAENILWMEHHLIIISVNN